MPRNWSTAPYPASFAHEDGSRGSTFTCAGCNKRLHKGESLQLRAYLGDYRELLARAAIVTAAGPQCVCGPVRHWDCSACNHSGAERRAKVEGSAALGRAT
jgi:hypothetical protein